MESVDLFKFTLAVAFPILFKGVLALYSNHFSRVKLHREGISLLKEVVDDDLTKLSNEKKLILEETLSHYYKKELTYVEWKILSKCTSPRRAIKLYLKNHYFLKLSKNERFFEYKNNPIKEWKFFGKHSVEVNVTLVKHFIGYLLSGMPGWASVFKAIELFSDRHDAYAITMFTFGSCMVALSLVLLNSGANFLNQRKSMERALGKQLKLS